MSRIRQVCSFVLGDLVFGVEVMKVQEVLRFQAMTRVPLASSMVRGLINLRGQIVTAVDVRARFGLPPLSAEREPMNVVLSTGDSVVSLLVDDIGDVLDLDEADFERPPATLPAVFRDVVVGVYKLERTLLLMLDVERIVTPEPSPSAVGNAA
jgi:purine-binding chemotaxis protein CheW